MLLALPAAATLLLSSALVSPSGGGGGLAGSALGFDAKDAVVRVPLSDSLNNPTEVCLEAWVYADSVDAGGIAGMWGEGGGIDRYLLDFSGGEVFARVVTNGDGRVDVSAPAPLSTWFHVAMTLDGAELKLFLDGALVASAPAAGELIPASNDLLMGVEDISFGPPPEFLEGRLDEVRVWDSARSDAQIAQCFNQRVSPTAPGLIGVWSFDEPFGEQTCFDGSPAANHGTLGMDGGMGSDDPDRVRSGAAIRWQDLDQGLAGAGGVPRFAGQGSLISPDPASFVLSNAPAGARGVLILGFTPLYAPFSGGTMVPQPDMFFWHKVDASGEVGLDLNWPPGVPPLTNLYLQWWVKDDTAAKGWAASNALRIETP